MRITIKSFLTLRDVMGNQSAFNLEVDNLTVIELMHELANMFGNRFSEMIFEKDGDQLSPYIRIIINGSHYSHIPQKLNTPLQEGDEVLLFPPIVGG